MRPAARLRNRIACVAVGLLLAGCGDVEDSRIVSALGRWTGPQPSPPPPTAWMDPGPPGPVEAPAPAASTPSAAGEIEVIEGGETSELSEPRSPGDEAPLYGYLDASGSMRMVRGLENVPPAHRGRAQNLTASAPVNFVAIPRRERRARRRVIDWEPAFNPNRADVVLFSAVSCGACARTRAYLDRIGVSYDLRDIQEDPGAKDEVRRVLGRVAVPLIQIGGRYISGFMPSEIDRALARAG